MQQKAPRTLHDRYFSLNSRSSSSNWHLAGPGAGAQHRAPWTSTTTTCCSPMNCRITTNARGPRWQLGVHTWRKATDAPHNTQALDDIMTMYLSTEAIKVHQDTHKTFLRRSRYLTMALAINTCDVREMGSPTSPSCLGTSKRVTRAFRSQP